MVIFELGIVNNGVPIISKQYYKEHGMSVDPLLRGGFLSALDSFATEVFADEMESFSMKNFKIVLLSRLFRETQAKNGSKRTPKSSRSLY